MVGYNCWRASSLVVWSKSLPIQAGQIFSIEVDPRVWHSWMHSPWFDALLQSWDWWGSCIKWFIGCLPHGSFWWWWHRWQVTSIKLRCCLWQIWYVVQFEQEDTIHQVLWAEKVQGDNDACFGCCSFFWDIYRERERYTPQKISIDLYSFFGVYISLSILGCI